MADKIKSAIENDDLRSLLTIYDNKGLLALAAQYLKNSKRIAFEGWLTRMLRDEAKSPSLAEALKTVLPMVMAN